MTEKSNKKLLGSDDRGVSPVIGVILMVVITVILAAVIGAFVLGLGDSVESEVTAGASISVSDDTATITWTNEGDATSLNVQASTDETDVALNSDGQSTTETISSIGGSTDIQNTGTAAGDVRITVTATDGDKETVILTREVHLDAP